MQHSDSAPAKSAQLRILLLILPNTTGITLDSTGEYWNKVIKVARKTMPDRNDFTFRIDHSV